MQRYSAADSNIASLKCSRTLINQQRLNIRSPAGCYTLQSWNLLSGMSSTIYTFSVNAMKHAQPPRNTGNISSQEPNDNCQYRASLIRTTHKSSRSHQTVKTDKKLKTRIKLQFHGTRFKPARQHHANMQQSFQFMFDDLYQISVCLWYTVVRNMSWKGSLLWR